MRLKENTGIIRQEEKSNPHICIIPEDVWIEASRSESHRSSDPEKLVFWLGEISALDGRNCVRKVWESWCT